MASSQPCQGLELTGNMYQARLAQVLEGNQKSCWQDVDPQQGSAQTSQALGQMCTADTDAPSIKGGSRVVSQLMWLAFWVSVAYARGLALFRF